MKKKSLTKKEVIIYQTKSGAISLRGDFSSETIWATQAEIAKIFSVTPQNITIHLKNIYAQKELLEKATCKESLQVQIEGGRSIVRKTKEYNLEVLIAVGYRINSVTGTKFRQWATSTLRSHIVDGYTINKARITKNYDTFLKAVADVRTLLPPTTTIGNDDILELIQLFADTWMSLDAYDKETFDTKKVTKKKISLTATKLLKNIQILKEELLQKGEATELFATERTRGSLEGIVGNVLQSLGGSDVYKSVEEKASHLLYFVIKNHPFIDGNKRTGAYIFVWFLNMAKILDTKRLTPEALTAITLLIAESDPNHKEKMIKLVIMLISKK